MRSPSGVLHLDPETLNACVSCGLCLPHCPTYRVTGREIASPRGRIAAMRAVESGTSPVDDAFRAAMEECVSCRGCEAACPSGVHFGELMESTRAALPPPRSRTRRIAEWLGYSVVLPRHWLLLVCTWLAWVGQRLHVVPRRLGLPRLSGRSLRTPLAVPVGGTPDAWLFTGCVMDAWMRDTHRSAARVMSATGATVGRPAAAACCGALHLHAGRDSEARALAERVVASMPGPAPVVVDSAGCGAAMKEYGQLLDTPAAHAFSARVADFSEWLAGRPPLRLRRMHTRIVVQDPCHLRHVQKAHGAVRAVLAPAYDLTETADEGLCCGAGGAYAIAQRDLSRRILGRKVAALRAVADDPDRMVVASANPGCIVQLQGAGVDARHPADLIAEALDD